jgi:hypothetical protein
MICDDAAEYVSALCDFETIPPAAAEHIATCTDCQRRLNDYLALGVELRRSASLELSNAVPSRNWAKPQNRAAALWQRGWGTMRIPRLAFVALVVSVLVLASGLAVVKVRAHGTGTVVLLSTVGPSGPLADCPLSTLDKNQACSYLGKVGSRLLAYKVKVLSRDSSRVLLAIRTRSVTPGGNLNSFERDIIPAKEVWFEPGKPLKFDVPEVGTLTLNGKWMDHMPILGTLDPGPNELRLGSPLLLKDKAVIGDLSSVIGGIYSQDDQDRTMALYIPGQGRFLLSQLPMKGAVEAHVALGRVAFEEGGHSWELMNGVPICRADHIWVLHQPDFKPKEGPTDVPGFSNPKLVQSEPGVWVPEQTTN